MCYQDYGLLLEKNSQIKNYIHILFKLKSEVIFLLWKGHPFWWTFQQYLKKGYSPVKLICRPWVWKLLSVNISGLRGHSNLKICICQFLILQKKMAKKSKKLKQCYPFFSKSGWIDMNWPRRYWLCPISSRDILYYIIDSWPKREHSGGANTGIKRKS